MTIDSGRADTACEAFQSILPKLIESGTDLYIHPHLQSCGLCRALIVDLDRIAEESRNRPGKQGTS
jgi:hypothetical protein